VVDEEDNMAVCPGNKRRIEHSAVRCNKVTAPDNLLKLWLDNHLYKVFFCRLHVVHHQPPARGALCCSCDILLKP